MLHCPDILGGMLGLEVNKICFPVGVVTSPAKLRDVLSEHFSTEAFVTCPPKLNTIRLRED